MIGRIVNFQASPDVIANARTTLLSQAATILKAQSGLEVLHIFARDGKAAVISIWKDQSAADGAMAAMSGMRDKMVGIGLTPRIDDFDVIA